MDSNLTTIVVLGTVLHVAVLVVMIWIRVRRTEPDASKGASAKITPCAVCGEPAIRWSYDGLDPNEQINPRTGRAWSFDMAHYQPLCAEHDATAASDVRPRLGDG